MQEPQSLTFRRQFTEVEDMILKGFSSNVHNSVEQLRKHRPDILPWQLERTHNHEHPTTESSHRALRVAREMGEELATALKEAYPERGFVLVYVEEQLSFYQRGNGAPEDDTPPKGPLPDRAWCDVCGDRKLYRLHEQEDSEFPKADWGDCADCGSEVMVRTWGTRVLI